MAFTAFGLAACVAPPQHLSADFGNAVNHNIAAQVDNPMPNERIGAGPQDGERLERAIERYRTNKVYQPRLPLEGGRIYDQQPIQQQ
jgi:hypothetical protein